MKLKIEFLRKRKFSFKIQKEKGGEKYTFLSNEAKNRI